MPKALRAQEMCSEAVRQAAMLYVLLRHRVAVRAALAAVEARVEEDEDVGEAWLEGQLRGYRALKETGAVNPDDVAWKQTEGKP